MFSESVKLQHELDSEDKHSSYCNILTLSTLREMRDTFNVSERSIRVLSSLFRLLGLRPQLLLHCHLYYRPHQTPRKIPERLKNVR